MVAVRTAGGADVATVEDDPVVGYGAFLFGYVARQFQFGL